MEDLADVDAAFDQLDASGLDVVDNQQQALQGGLRRQCRTGSTPVIRAA